MKPVTTMKSVISLIGRRASRTTPLLALLFISWQVVSSPYVYGFAPDDPGEMPYVRVKWRQDFDGLIHRDFLVKDARIVEVSEYSGILMDAGGHVAVYIPDPLKLSSPQGDFSVTDGSGKTTSAELLGVDQRLSIAFLKMETPNGVQAVFGPELTDSLIRVVSWGGASWEEEDYRVIASNRNFFGPVLTIEAAATGSPGAWRVSRNSNPARRSSFILDQEGRLLGLGVSSIARGLTRRTLEFKVFPVAVVRESLSQLRQQAGALLESGWMGVYIDSAESGVKVNQVVPGSPALEVGIRPGDIIVNFNRHPLGSVEDFIQAVKWSGPRQKVKLTVAREGSRQEYELTLGKAPIYQKPAYEWALDIPSVLKGPEQLAQKVRFRPVPSSRHRGIGLQVDPLTTQLAGFFKSPTGKGLLVEAVEADSLAAQIGLRAGDVLIMIDDQVLRTSSDLVRIMDACQEPLTLSYVRNGEVIKQKILFR